MATLDTSWSVSVLPATPLVPPPTPAATIDIGHGDVIPDFGAEPTIASLRSGRWSDPATWSPGRVPNLGDSVRIAAGHTVTLDDHEAIAGIITVDGTACLSYKANADVTLRVLTLFTRPRSLLSLARDDGYQHRTVFLDFPFDANDPRQYGHGLVVLGHVDCGTASYRTPRSRASAEISVASDRVTLTAPPSGWRFGDLLLFPDSRDLSRGPVPDEPGFVSQTELASVSGVAGATVTLQRRLANAHRGAADRDGVVDFTPWVANLTRDTVFVSERRDGVRGHCINLGHAAPNYRDCAFIDMGRSTLELWGPTNQKGRYPLHFHHLHHPFSAMGCVVYGTDPVENRHRGGIVIHGSHYGVVSDNVVYNTGGAGIATEEGNETGVTISGNLVSSIHGWTKFITQPNARDRSDAWFEGVGIWLAGFGCPLLDNVVCDTLQGITYYPNGLPTSINRPRPDGTQEAHNPYAVVPEFARNEVCGGRTTDGMATWSLGWCIRDGINQPIPGMGRTTFEDYRVWHAISKGHYNYTTSQITFLRPRFRGGVTGFFSSDYHAVDFRVEGADVRGFFRGLQMHPYDDVTVQGGVWANQNNFWVVTRFTAGPQSDLLVPSTLRLEGVTSRKWCRWGGETCLHVYLEYQTGVQGTNLMATQRVLVTDWQGVAGDSFRLFRAQQAESFVPPPSVPGVLTASPDPGKTNRQLLDLYGVCAFGEVTPAGATYWPDGDCYKA